MNFLIGKICELVNGTLQGDPNLRITKLSSIENGSEGSLTFYQNSKFHPFLYKTHASAALVGTDFVPDPAMKPQAFIRVANPYVAFNQLLHIVQAEKLPQPTVEEPHFVSPTAQIGENVYIGAFAYIGQNAVVGKNARIYPQVYIGDNVTIGDNTILYPQTVVYYDCKIGRNCIIHSGAIIGADGYGFLQNERGESIKIPQVGNVVIEDDVEIGANTCIDRSTLGSTIIHRGVKLDNLIQIAHNVTVGEHSLITAQVGVSGSTKIGKHCILGGQTGVVGHIELADGTKVGAQSGVSKTVKEKGTSLRGAPAQELRKQLQQEAYQRQIPNLIARIEELEKKLELFSDHS